MQWRCQAGSAFRTNADLSRGRYDVAQAKLSVLRQQWDIFDRDGLSGQALGQVMVAFSRVDPEGGGTRNRTRRCNEPEPADWLRDKSSTSDGWLRSPTCALGITE